MGGNTIFAVVSVSALVSVGIGAAIMQCGMMIFFFGKYGASFFNEANGKHMVYYLSDLFVLSPGLAYAWTLSVIPSVAIAAIIVSTSIARDRLLKNDPVRMSVSLQSRISRIFTYVCDQVFDTTNLVWMLVFFANMGLMLLSLFDLHHTSRLHYLGVELFASCSVVLQFWVVYLDYTVERSTWHPVYVFDCIIILISFVALGMFSFGRERISAVSEWAILLLMVVLHALLPIRGARVVFSKPRGWHNPFHTSHSGGGQIILIDDRSVEKMDF
jgi:hypothetical protein